MNKKILAALLITSIAITGLFADVSLNNIDGDTTGSSSTTDMSIILNTTVTPIDYVFRLVNAPLGSNSATLISLAATSTDNEIIKNDDIDILNADEVGTFGIVIPQGNMDSNIQFKVEVDPSNFKSTTPANNSDIGPTPVVSDSSVSEGTFTPISGETAAYFTSLSYTPGLKQNKLIASFNLGWAAGTPNIRPDDYQSITKLAITVVE